MNYIQGIDSSQTVWIPQTREDLIEKDNTIRFIGSFVDSLDVAAFGFRDIRLNIIGRPPFHLKDLLKLYIYGYLNKIKSSRRLEMECKRNIALIWLVKSLVPERVFRKLSPKFFEL